MSGWDAVDNDFKVALQVSECVEMRDITMIALRCSVGHVAEGKINLLYTRTHTIQNIQEYAKMYKRCAKYKSIYSNIEVVCCLYFLVTHGCYQI